MYTEKAEHRAYSCTFKGMCFRDHNRMMGRGANKRNKVQDSINKVQ